MEIKTKKKEKKLQATGLKNKSAAITLKNNGRNCNLI